MAKAKDSKPAAKGGKGDKAGKGDAKSKKGGGGGKGGSKADADSGETRLTKLKGAMTINVRHILVSIRPSIHPSAGEGGVHLRRNSMEMERNGIHWERGRKRERGGLMDVSFSARNTPRVRKLLRG
jgi:hypothetical protein